MWGEPKDKTPLVDDVPAHRKTRKKTTPKKANHKHDYVHIIGRWTKEMQNYKTGRKEPEVLYIHMTRCSICGNLGYLSYKEFRAFNDDDFYFSTRTNLPEKYPNLQVVDVPPQF